MDITPELISDKAEEILDAFMALIEEYQAEGQADGTLEALDIATTIVLLHLSQKATSGLDSENLTYIQEMADALEVSDAEVEESNETSDEIAEDLLSGAEDFERSGEGEGGA